MTHWIAYKELFLCTTIVAVIGIIMGLIIMRDQDIDKAYLAIHQISFETSHGETSQETFVVAVQ